MQSAKKTITLSDLPKEVEQFIHAKTAEPGCDSAEDFVRSLLVQEAEMEILARSV